MNEDRPGWAVGRGWYPIVEEANEQLKELDPGYEVVQIKEKFGGLRYYFAPTDGAGASTRTQMNAVIARAEDRAWVTCEDCGAAGECRTTNSGWLVTLCDNCAVKWTLRED